MVELQLTQYNVEQFLLVLVRIASFLYTAPIFSMNRTIPNKVKIGFAVLISFLLFPTIPMDEVYYSSVIQYAAVVLKETTVGLVIGYMSNICLNILTFAGRVIDTEIGFAMVTLFDPATSEQVSITGTIYNYFIMLLLIVSNMYQYIVRAAVDSYTLIPIGGINIHLTSLYKLFMQYTTDCFVIGFRIVLPYFTVTIILNIILGILAKIAPQMNMFVIGLQLKVFSGFLVMIIVAMLLPSIANFIFEEMKTLVVAAIEAMS